MRVLALPAEARALILDFDGTLYSNPGYASFQEEVLVGRLARELGEEAAATRARLARMRAEREAAGLGKTSLGRLFAELGVSIRTSVLWREQLIEPGRWLVPDARLDEALARLEARYALALVTNNPSSVGAKGLEALGVARRFRALVGLADTMESKPAPEPFLLAARLLGVPAPSCVSVGDRLEVDLAPALGLGMGAILVEGVEDLYGLPGFLVAGPAPSSPREARRGGGTRS